jgi:hypothetical protein
MTKTVKRMLDLTSTAQPILLLCCLSLLAVGCSKGHSTHEDLGRVVSKRWQTRILTRLKSTLRRRPTCVRLSSNLN